MKLLWRFFKKGNILLHNITESQNSLPQDVVYGKTMNGSESK